MKLSNFEWAALMSIFRLAKSGEDAKALFEMWLDEKYDEVFKTGWLEACKEYDIKDTFYVEDKWLDDGGYDED